MHFTNVLERLRNGYQLREASRVKQLAPVDYVDPFQLKLHGGRCSNTRKANSKALHLELVSDLSTETFLAALKRFTARKGLLTDIFSDNGSNFIGAKNSLTEMHNLSYSTRFNTKVSFFLGNQGIKWHFIPPLTPHFGGVWEAGVKQTKFHLKRVIEKSSLTFEEMNTLLRTNTSRGNFKFAAVVFNICNIP